MTSHKFESPKWPIWKTIIRHVLDAFELDDHEYIKASFNRWPFSAWLTILEPRYRHGWKKFMPWRVRFAWASLVRQIVWSECTKCGQRFSARELVRRPNDLQYFMSGSICHKNCEPTEEWKAMVQRMHLPSYGHIQQDR